MAFAEGKQKHIRRINLQDIASIKIRNQSFQVSCTKPTKGFIFPGVHNPKEVVEQLNKATGLGIGENTPKIKLNP